MNPTKILEKKYRNAKLHAKDSIKQAYNLQGQIIGDFIKLTQKHPEYFTTPAQTLKISKFILENATLGMRASDKRFRLIIAPLKKDYGAVILRTENKNNEHRIRSVLIMDKKQVESKIKKSKEQGEPILHFC